MPSPEPLQNIRAELSFTRPEDVTPDRERPGVLRAPDQEAGRAAGRHIDVQTIAARDCGALADFTPDLVEHGFAYADLSAQTKLQATLERIRGRGRLEEPDVAEIRSLLRSRSLPLSGGRRMKVLFVAPEGFLMRRAGPNGMKLHADGTPLAESLDGALVAHADQDIGGTPLREIMRGAAPWLFRHEAPDSHNARSPLFLLNVWIPLEQITRPLCLMDSQTLDRPRHQLRFGLKVDTLLGRGEERAVNHVWSFLHDDAQRWYFTSELDTDTAYVFDTLGTPHGSVCLPGEELAEARYRQLDDARAAIDARDEPGLARATSGERPEPGEGVTAPLRRAIAQMDTLLEEASGSAAALCRGEGAAAWRGRAERAQERVVRKSIELRAIGIVTRDAWPFRLW